MQIFFIFFFSFSLLAQDNETEYYSETLRDYTKTLEDLSAPLDEPKNILFPETKDSALAEVIQNGVFDGVAFFAQRHVTRKTFTRTVFDKTIPLDHGLPFKVNELTNLYTEMAEVTKKFKGRELVATIYGSKTRILVPTNAPLKSYRFFPKNFTITGKEVIANDFDSLMKKIKEIPYINDSQHYGVQRMTVKVKGKGGKILFPAVTLFTIYAAGDTLLDIAHFFNEKPERMPDTIKEKEVR